MKHIFRSLIRRRNWLSDNLLVIYILLPAADLHVFRARVFGPGRLNTIITNKGRFVSHVDSRFQSGLINADARAHAHALGLVLLITFKEICVTVRMQMKIPFVIKK